MEKDSNLEASGGNEPEITVKISFPALVFELEINLGSDGLQIGDVSGWRLTYMKLIISKRLIGLSLQCKVNMDNKNPDSIDSTFTGEVTVSLYTFGRGYFICSRPRLNGKQIPVGAIVNELLHQPTVHPQANDSIIATSS
jgi:hypothetical protein